MRKRDNFAQLCFTFKGQVLPWWQLHPPPPFKPSNLCQLPFGFPLVFTSISLHLSLPLSNLLAFPCPDRLQDVFLQCLASDTVADVFIKSTRHERGGLSEGATGRTDATTLPRTTTTAHWWELMQRPICREVGETGRIRTWAFQSRYSNLLEFVCLALKSSFPNPDWTRERERLEVGRVQERRGLGLGMAIQMKTQSAQPDFRGFMPHWELYCVLTRHSNLPVFPHWKWIQHGWPMRFQCGRGYLVHYFVLVFCCFVFLLLLKLKWSIHNQFTHS